MTSPVATVRDLMLRFTERTGVGAGGSRRYLWTDAFAVCNLLGLARATGDARQTDVALRLVDEVHHTLGRHRADDARHGWISGLTPEEGESHPTRGGLRIGKPLPERGPAEPLDEQREWDRDGQYFHYATKWMHALDQTAGALGQPLFNVWARELAHAAHRGFTYALPSGRGRRMYWKVSIDLSRPLVTSMGQHDPLDGFLTCVQLEATATAMGAPGPSLRDVTADFAAMIDRDGLATADPLGIGGLLVDAYRVEQLRRRAPLADRDDLLVTLLDAAIAGLRAWIAQRDMERPARERLAFRELGLAIGLAAVEHLDRDVRRAASSQPTLASRLSPLLRLVPLGAEITSFWQRPGCHQTEAWQGHQDINEVMLATALLPDGFLTLQASGG